MGVPLLLSEEFELVIMIAVAIEEMLGSDRVLLERIKDEPWLVRTVFQLERRGALCRANAEVRS